MRVSPWALVEVWLTAQLLKSPTFHRAVGRFHGRVQRLRHGVPEETGGTNIDNPAPGPAKQFLQYFKEEIKAQMKGKRPPKGE